MAVRRPDGRDGEPKLMCHSPKKGREMRMQNQTWSAPRLATLAAAIALAGAMAACGPKAPEPPAAAAPAAEAPPSAPPAAQAAPEPATASQVDPAQVETLLALSPEAMEALLAPIALYPDAVLAHVLTAATNPQMVLDAGNWLIANPELSGRALDEAAQPLGFSPSMRALLQFPEIVDMMCMQLEWTTQLGEAFTADQAGALDAVQRLRLQATEVGNLASSEQLTVATEVQEGRDVITVAPADPKVVYVPQYDPVAVYAPPPATLPAPATAAAPEAEKKSGHSTGSLITTGLLSFGAGLLVAEIFDDDDDWDDYRPNYGYGGMYYGGRPYYPPPPAFYRPVYGNSFRPGYGYTRPPNYQHGFNNNVVIVNNQGNDYWNSYNQRPGAGQTRPVSPITTVRADRPELRDTARQERPARPVPAADDKRAGWQGQSTYAGAKDRAREPTAAAAQRANPGAYAGAAQARPAASTERARAAAAANASRERPAQQGSVDRGRDDRQRPASAPANKPKPAASRPAQLPQARPEARPQARPEARPQARPEARPSQQPAQRPARAPAQQRGGGGNSRGGAQPSSFGGPSRGGNDRAASERGRSSMPEGARSKGAAPKRPDNQRQGR
jgi:hypothetical protein